jgi:hypothetical protein
MAVGADLVYIPASYGFAANVGPRIPGTTRPAYPLEQGGDSPSKTSLGGLSANENKHPLGALGEFNAPQIGHAAPIPNYQPHTFRKNKGYPGGGTWQWHSPPGVGDAPQHVWTTYYLAPVDNIRGPGDMPISYINTARINPTLWNFAMRQLGMPITGGNILLSGLYTPQPITPY